MTQEEKGKDMKVRVFNIVIQPSDKHNEKYYKELIEHVFRSSKTYVTAKDKCTKIRSCNISEHVTYGTLVNYTIRDKDDMWYNSSKESFQKLDVDPNLNPNAREWDFYFYTKYHRIAVPSKRGMSYSNIHKYFSLAFRDAADALGYEDVTVTCEVSKHGIDAIFELDEVKTITIEVSFSNNDNYDDWAEAIDTDLKEMRVGHMKTIATAPKNGKINVESNSLIGGLVKLSQHNGKVKAEGKKDGVKKKINTENFPNEVKMKKVNENNIISKITSAIENMINC